MSDVNVKYTCQIEMPNVIELGDSINVDGKYYKVSSFEVDERDDRLKIKLAMASTKKEKSDDKPTKGRD